ncbi:hypothetical protein BWI96_11865 [Siphonobacter sp. SORGH_AS_0500]|uniref:site-specific integrase n=1 Tax=Siphonobacter sp. SORGH_AS_0500 TaxID=1864824 RepID=UPI000CBB6296|nr:site-specific integrase [Siphonobacter sp. SORGH_AS_0500]PKK36544.1 hypothetical protein BWI96_11865 [Siphonobacter sp. SORGH_AS_0500]
MINKFHFAYHLRTEGISEQGLPIIYAKATLNGNRINIGSTGIRVSLDNWDIQRRRIRLSDTISMMDNAKLDSLESQVRSVILYAESRQERVTPEQLKKALRPASARQTDVFTLLDKYLEWSEQMSQKGDHAISTHKTRKEKLALVKYFLEEEKKTKLLVEEINRVIMERFINYMLLKRNAKKVYAQKCQQFIKTFVIWCWENGHIDINPLDNYKVKVDKTPNLEHLSEAELTLLTTTVFPKRLQETVDCYLFACNTGLAYVDMKLLNESNVVEVGGRLYLQGAREKTDTKYFVPLSKVAQAIIVKYGGVSKLPLRSNKEVNCMLKVAMAQIGVNRRIWFHTGRKTFAMRMQNEFLRSDETTAAMLGHKSTKELKTYRNITKERVIKEMSNFDF